MNAWMAWMLSVPAFAALSRVMERHRDEAGGSSPIATAELWRWRMIGVLFLVLSLLQCLHHWSPSIAVVAWLGALTFAALLVGAVLTYRPARLKQLAAWLAVIGVCGAAWNW